MVFYKWVQFLGHSSHWEVGLHGLSFNLSKFIAAWISRVWWKCYTGTRAQLMKDHDVFGGSAVIFCIYTAVQIHSTILKLSACCDKSKTHGEFMFRWMILAKPSPETSHKSKEASLWLQPQVIIIFPSETTVKIEQNQDVHSYYALSLVLTPWVHRCNEPSFMSLHLESVFKKWNY